MQIQKIIELKKKLNEEISEDNIDSEQLLKLSQKLDELIVEAMKEQLRNTNLSVSCKN